MYKDFRVLFLIILVLASNFVVAQTLTNSPYSRYGVGDLQFQGSGRSRAMGNTAIGSTSAFHINKVNPASYGSFLKNTFIMEVAVENKVTYFETGNDSQFSNYSNLSKLAAGFQIFPEWGTSFGLMPYSGVGYEATSYDSLYVDDEYSVFNNTYLGKGGLSELYWGNSFTFFNNYSLGLNTSYIFGSMDKNSVASISESGFLSKTYTYDRTLLNGFNYKFGFQYNDSIRSKKDTTKNMVSYTLGLTFENTTKLKAYNTLLLIRKTQSTILKADTIVNDTLTNGHVMLPRSIGVGGSVKLYEKFTISADYYIQNWEATSFLDQSQPLVNSSSIGVGMEYCNNPISTIYGKRIRYRVGGYYSNTYLKLNDYQIKDYGVTFGGGFPVKTSLINASFQLGTRGALDQNLIKESYVLFNLNFSLYDTWFVKRRFF